MHGKMVSYNNVGLITALGNTGRRLFIGVTIGEQGLTFFTILLRPVLAVVAFHTTVNHTPDTGTVAYALALDEIAAAIGAASTILSVHGRCAIILKA